MPIEIIVMLKSILIFGSAFALVYRFYRYPQAELVWLLALFFALFSAHVAFWLGFLLNLPGTNFVLYPLYLFVLSFSIRVVSHDCNLPNFNKNNFNFGVWGFLEITAILFAFGLYYAYFSRGIPSSGGMYFSHLDLLKFTEETGRLYPFASENLTLASYPLTINAAHYGLLVLLGCGLGFEGHVLSYGFLHGIFVCGFFIYIATVSREIFGSRYWAYVIFPLLFAGIHGWVASNHYLNVPGSEVATYFLIGCTLFFLRHLLYSRNKKNNFTLFFISALMTVSARPYTIPFVAAFSVVAFVIFFKKKSLKDVVNLLQTQTKVVLFFALITPFIFFLNIRNIFAYGSPFPIGNVHSTYSSTTVGINFFENFIKTVRLFAHYYFPYIEAALFRVDAEVAYYDNEISLLVSTLALLGILVGLRSLNNSLKESKEQVFLTALGIIITVLLTALVLVPKNRMFYWFTPVALLFACAGIREIVKLNWKALLAWVTCLSIIGVLTLQPRSLFALLVKKNMIRFPQESHSVSFEGSVEYMGNIRTAIASIPNSQVMVTGVEPGLDDFVLTPHRYYWESIAFPQDVELVFENMAWNKGKCLAYLRDNNIRIISMSVPRKAQIHFLANKENSSRLWDMILENPEYFNRIDTLKGDYKHRSIYQVL